MKINKFVLVTSIIFLAAASRLLPHPPNFTPLASMALLGAAFLKRKEFAIFIPLVALFLSDLIINNVVLKLVAPEYYSGFQLLGNGWVYLSFVLIGLIGIFTLNKVTVVRVAGSVGMATILFFLVTNFGMLFTSTVYPMSLGGLLASYTAGLPFMLNDLLGNVFFATIFFGAYSYFAKTKVQLA